MAGQPHDALFKAAFSKPEHALQLLHTIAAGHPHGAALLALLEGASVQLVPGSFVDAELAQVHTDLLFEVHAPQGHLFLYTLFEHQSQGYRRMPLRVYTYLDRIWTRYDYDHAQGPLPPILPIVVSHVPGGWHDPTHFHELFDRRLFTEFPLLAEHVPSFRFALDDLWQLDDDTLDARPLADFAKLAFYLLRDGRAGRVLAAMHRWVHILVRLSREALEATLQYIAALSERDLVIWDDFRANLRALAPAAEEEIMNRRSMTAPGPKGPRAKRGLREAEGRRS
jgi:hypothetical protein